MRGGIAYYRREYLGTIADTLDEAFNLPMNGKFRVTIKEEGPYKIVLGSYFCRIIINKEHSGYICKSVFLQLFFKPDGRKNYDIKVKRIRKGIR